MNLINGEVKIKRRRGEVRRINESLPNFIFVRSRIKAIRQARYFLAGKHEAFCGLRSFKALVESIDSFDKTLLLCEEILVRYALGELGVNELHEELMVCSEQLELRAEELSPHELREVNSAAHDVNALMKHVWSEIWELVYSLQDALKSIWDDDKIGLPKWLLEFEKHEAPRFKRNGRSDDEMEEEIRAKSIELPRAYAGDFEVENGDFALAAKHFVVREDGVSFDFEGEGEEGSFRLEGSLVRKDDGQFEVKRFDYSASQFHGMLEATIDLKVVKPVFGACKVVGEWRQNGEIWQFSGKLIPYRSASSGEGTIPLS